MKSFAFEHKDKKQYRDRRRQSGNEAQVKDKHNQGASEAQT